MVNVEIKGDGSLYCDIDATIAWGLPYETDELGLSILYPQETIWEPMGEIFISGVLSDCPVDTGFMRDHNHYLTDQGGIEFWSDAEYSVYQEYGTSRFRAQPWFEPSITTAVGKFESLAQGIYQQHLKLEDLIVQALTIMETAETSVEAQHAITLLEQALVLAPQIQYPTEEIEILLDEAYELYEELLEAEEEEEEAAAAMAAASRTGSLVGGLVGGLVSLGVSLLFENMIWETGRHSGPVEQSLISGVEGAANSFLQYNNAAFGQGLIGPGEFFGGVVVGFGFALIGTLFACAMGDIFDDHGEHAEHVAAMNHRGGFSGRGGWGYDFFDDRDTTHHPSEGG